MKKKYKFKQNSFSKFKDQKEAQKIGEFLEEHFPDSNFKPDQIVDLARPKNSLLHKYFEWDDTKAAANYRIQQARGLVVSLYIEIEEGEARAYEHVYLKELDSSQYASLERISEAPDLFSQVLESAKKDLLYWRTKYAVYRSHFENVFSEIEKLGVVNEKDKDRSETSGREGNKGSANRHKRGKHNPRGRQPTPRL